MQAILKCRACKRAVATEYFYDHKVLLPLMEAHSMSYGCDIKLIDITIIHNMAS